MSKKKQRKNAEKTTTEKQFRELFRHTMEPEISGRNINNINDDAIMPPRRFKIGDPVVARNGGCRWRRGTVSKVNYTLEHGLTERCFAELLKTSIVPYQIRSKEGKFFFSLADVDTEIVYDSAPPTKNRFEVDESVYCQLSDGKWEHCRVVMHNYPIHTESLSKDMKFAAYQVVNGSNSARWVPYDTDKCIRKFRPATNISMPKTPVLQTSTTIISPLMQWHRAYEWVVSTYSTYWKEDRHNRMQTAMNRIQSRKQEMKRGKCKEQKLSDAFEENKQNGYDISTLSYDLRQTRCINMKYTLSSSDIAKQQGEKLLRIEKFKTAISERKTRQASIDAKIAAVQQMMLEKLEIGYRINEG